MSARLIWASICLAFSSAALRRLDRAGFELPAIFQGDTQCEMCISIVRAKFQRPTKAGYGLLRLILSHVA